jgi:hypothetical protein
LLTIGCDAGAASVVAECGARLALIGVEYRRVALRGQRVAPDEQGVGGRAQLTQQAVRVRNILMDYVKPVVLRLTLQVLVIAALIGYTGWTIQVLWGGP